MQYIATDEDLPSVETIYISFCFHCYVIAQQLPSTSIVVADQVYCFAFPVH